MAVTDVLLALPHTRNSTSSDAVKSLLMAKQFANGPVPEPWLPAHARDDSRPSTAASFVTARPDTPKHDILDVDRDIAPTLEHEHPPPSSAEPDWLARLDKLPTSIPASTSQATDRRTHSFAMLLLLNTQLSLTVTIRHSTDSSGPTPPPLPVKAASRQAPHWTPTRANDTIHDGPFTTTPTNGISLSPEAVLSPTNAHTRDQTSTAANGTHTVPPSLRPGHTCEPYSSSRPYRV